MKRSRRIFPRERFFLSAGRTLSRSCIEKADTHTTKGRNMCIENADTRTPEGLGRIFRAVMVLLPRFVRRGSERRRRGTTPRTPCVSMGKIGKKKIGASERRHNFFFPLPRRKKKSEKVLARTLFFCGWHRTGGEGSASAKLRCGGFCGGGGGRASFFFLRGRIFREGQRPAAASPPAAAAKLFFRRGGRNNVARIADAEYLR